MELYFFSLICFRGIDGKNFKFYVKWGVVNSPLSLLYPAKEPPVPTELEAGYTPELA
jgi:hypothetical protein